MLSSPTLLAQIPLGMLTGMKLAGSGALVRIGVRLRVCSMVRRCESSVGGGRLDALELNSSLVGLG